jgi:hypothetical protein
VRTTLTRSLKIPRLSLCIAAAIALLGATSQAVAAASAAEAAKLGTELTPMGGEKAGNTAGTIPAWNGGYANKPAGFKPGDHHADPFASDKIQFTISATNLAQYKANLGAGQLAMFAKYPNFKMNVYQTRRSAAFPERIYEMTKKNATTAQMIGDGAGVKNAAEGAPFPIPKSAYEIIWNHKLKFKGEAVVRWENSVTPSASGDFTPVRIQEKLFGMYYRKGNTTENINNVLAYFLQTVESPARLAGNVLLVHETMNQELQARQAWIYNPGQRRVRKAPQVAYDNPGTGADGLRSNDMTDMFNGALDRYTFKTIGKKEMYVNYNSYKAHAAGVKFTDFVRPGFLNPDLMRYELHRVWVVEANLRQGARHQMSKRTFYVDEDSWQIMMLDHYDSAGALWRYSEAAGISYYDQPLFWTTTEAHHDLKSGRYVASGLDNLEQSYNFSTTMTPADFGPQALRTSGTR